MLMLMMLLQSGGVLAPAPSVGPVPVPCGPGLMEARSGQAASSGLLRLDRADGGREVRRYLLLDLRDQNNCPLPISFPVPEASRALGREWGGRSPETPGFDAPTPPEPTPRSFSSERR